MSLVPLPLPQVTDDAERRVGDSVSPLSPSLPNQAELSASPIILSAALKQLADMAGLALQHQQDTFQHFVKFVKVIFCHESIEASLVHNCNQW